jgi:hypothetical protein
MSSSPKFSCGKCGNTEYKSGQIRTTGSGLSRFLNVQNQKFETFSCTECGYTELFRADGSGIGNFFDAFTN